MLSRPNISVVTATYARPKWLKACCEQIRNQSLGNILIEHIVVSDGPDVRAEKIATEYGSTFYSLKKRRGRFGAVCKDFALKVAQGEYVVFFDDDNLYFPHALVALYATSVGVQIGVCQTIHRGIAIPRLSESPFRYGNIDSMCFCVEARFAQSSSWRVAEIATDWSYFSGLLKQEPTYRISPIVVGEHLT